MFWALCAGIGMAAGVLGGVLGVGGGIIMVPAFTSLLGLGVRQAIGTSMAVIVFTAISASWRHWQNENLDLRVIVPVALLSIVGAQLGASLVPKLPVRALTMLFAVFLFVTAGQMFWKAWQMPAQ
jgi:hypothetical protein